MPSSGKRGCCPKLQRRLTLLWDWYGLRHSIFLFVMIAYAFFGAALFSWIETPYEIVDHVTKLNVSTKRANQITVMVASIYGQQNLSDQQKQADVYELIRAYQEEVGVIPNSERRNWDLWGALFYSGTLFTTIGYGNYSCRSTGGRIVTMIYALFGITLFLVTLQQLGKLLTKWIKLLWFKYCFCEWAMPINTANNEQKDSTSLNTVQWEEFNLPIWIAVLLLVGWLFLSSGIFCIWERNWSFFDSFYFFFITLTTIGLGDVVPEHPKYMSAAFLFVTFGLSLVTMVINLLQDRLGKINVAAEDYIEHKILDKDNDIASDSNCLSDPKAQERPNEVEYTTESHKSGYQTLLGIYQTPVKDERVKTIVHVGNDTNKTDNTTTGEVKIETESAAAAQTAT